MNEIELRTWFNKLPCDGIGREHWDELLAIARRPVPHAVGLEGVREALDGMEVVAQSIQSGIRHDSPEGAMKMHVNRLEELIRQAHGVILSQSPPAGVSAETVASSRRGDHYTIAHDGFAGTVIGDYVTLEGKRGVVMQLDNAKVVHVYGEKWLPPTALRASSPATAEYVPALIRNESAGFTSFVVEDVTTVTGQMCAMNVEPLYRLSDRSLIGFRIYDGGGKSKYPEFPDSSPAPAAQGETVEEHAELIADLQALGRKWDIGGQHASASVLYRALAALRSEGRGTEGNADAK